MQKRIITLLCAIGLAVSPITAAAQQLNLRPDAPARYTVRQGDTLWGISGKYLQRPWLWPRLWGANRNTIRNPHLIYPGQVLVLTYVNGQPRLSVEGGIPTIKLQPRIRETSAGYGISTLNINFYRMFMQHPQIMDAEQARNAPRLLAGVDNRTLFSLGDRVYSSPLPTSGDYLIYRIDRELRDPSKSVEPLGLRVVFVGKASTVPTRNSAGAPTVAQTLQITEQASEIRTGDYLLPFNGVETAFNMMPHAPQRPVRAKVLDVMNGISEAGQFSTITINAGLADGLQKGTVVSLYTPSRVVQNQSLPSSEIGLAMVYNAGTHVSSAIVLEAISNVSTGHLVAEPGHDVDTLEVLETARDD